MFSKILIANRGEIALRVMRACRELGIRSVAVYSEADRNALHVRSADEAALLGAAPPKESYLNIGKLIDAARQTGAQAVHPGYGFLSENADFAEAVQDAGLVFIGPPAAAIRLMGDKAASKAGMKKAGVPVVPGFEGLDTEKDFRKAAREIGYPVLVKAAAGGGGRGMRVVESEADLAEAVQGSGREALNAFGDGRLLLEKYIPHAHHIEVQVFGDGHGRLVHLFERECSVQRRHQKIIEESPSVLLTPELREKIGQAAVNAAQVVNYSNAGTVEFIFDPSLSSFFFLEMNTRLQVEHPVTELVTGLDLVQWQIKVAAGERFPYSQGQLIQRGHAIECRVYAEDPAGGFLPGTGRLLQYIEPQGPGIRVDSGFAAGDDVTHYYDPLLAKLIVRAEDRRAAIRRMQAALRDFIVHGLVTNIDFLQAVLSHPDFAKGEVTTRWVEEKFKWAPAGEPSLEMLAAAAIMEVSGVRSHVSGTGEADPFSPWKALNGFRMGG
jgi:acetyl-CoA carboxylase biotin carboxylase subunit